jgi:hypothetical protein
MQRHSFDKSSVQWCMSHRIRLTIASTSEMRQQLQSASTLRTSISHCCVYTHLYVRVQQAYLQDRALNAATQLDNAFSRVRGACSASHPPFIALPAIYLSNYSFSLPHNKFG